jgi:hypothetical protein
MANRFAAFEDFDEPSDVKKSPPKKAPAKAQAQVQVKPQTAVTNFPKNQ